MTIFSICLQTFDEDEVTNTIQHSAHPTVYGGFGACLRNIDNSSNCLFTPVSANTCPDFIIHRVQLPLFLHSTPRPQDDTEPCKMTSRSCHSARELSFTSISDWSIVDDDCADLCDIDSLFHDDFINCMSTTGCISNTEFLDKELDEIIREITRIGDKMELLSYYGNGAPNLNTSVQSTSVMFCGECIFSGCISLTRTTNSHCRTSNDYMWDYGTDFVTIRSVQFLQLDFTPHVDKNDNDSSSISFSRVNEPFYARNSLDYHSPCAYSQLYTSDLYIDDDFPEIITSLV